MSRAPLLEIRDLEVVFDTPAGAVQAVGGVSLDVHEGECLALVGESGSGKTQAMLACLGLLAGNGRTQGSVRYAGQELVGADEAALQRVRGTGIALLSQDPMNTLTPHLRIETQLVELLLDRGLATRAEARERAVQALREVDIPDPAARLRQYPHELSGGQRQRVALAIALMGRPRLLLADEPTTALDVSVQARVLDLLGNVCASGLGLLLVTHDLGVVAALADRVAVMYAGRLVEVAPVAELFAAPRHPYTAALLAAVPRLRGDEYGRLPAIAGTPPRPGQPAAGCAFAPRCRHAVQACRETKPDLRGLEPGAGVTVACHRPLSAVAQPA